MNQSEQQCNSSSLEVFGLVCPNEEVELPTLLGQNNGVGRKLTSCVNVLQQAGSDTLRTVYREN